MGHGNNALGVRLLCGAVGLLLLSVHPTAAQQVRTVTLHQAIEMAEQVQPRVIQAYGSVRSAEARVRSAKGAWLPSLTLSGTGDNNFSEGTSRVDPSSGQVINGNRTTTSLRSSISSSWEVFDGFRRSNDSRSARANALAADAGYTGARFQQALTTTNQFFDALSALQLQTVREAAVRRAEEQLNTSIARLRAGAATRSDTLRSAVTLGNARLQLLTAQTQLATARANLARLIGVRGQVGAADDSVFYRVFATIDTTTLRDEALAQAPVVLTAEANREAARASLKASKSSYWPTLTLQGTGSFTSSSTTDYQFFRGRSLALNVSWPIFNRFQREQTVANQSVAYDNADATARESQRQVEADLTTQLAQLQSARLGIQITQTSVVAAQEDSRVQQERYRLGAATIVDVLTSQEALNQAEVDAVNARFDYLRAKAQIEALIGRPL